MKRIGDIALLGLLVFVIAFGKVTLQASQDALLLWFEKLVPSMFVTLVMIRLLYHLQILEHLRIPFLPRLLHIDASTCTLVLCCMFLGFPNGALLIDEDYTNKRISLQGARRLLYTCSFPAPGFVIVSCGSLLFHSTRVGIQLFIAQLLSGLILLWLTKSTPIQRIHHDTHIPMQKIHALSLSIWESGKALFMIGGYLLVFMSVSTILVQFLPKELAVTLRIVCEFSSGTMLLQQLPYSSELLKVLTCMLLSFGGFCVHMQVYSMAEHLHFAYWRYVFYRIVQSFLSAAIFLLFLL